MLWDKDISTKKAAADLTIVLYIFVLCTSGCLKNLCQTLKPQDCALKGHPKKWGPVWVWNGIRGLMNSTTLHSLQFVTVLLCSLSVEFHISFKGFKEHSLLHFLISNQDQLHEQSNLQCVYTEAALLYHLHLNLSKVRLLLKWLQLLQIVCFVNNLRWMWEAFHNNSTVKINMKATQATVFSWHQKDI